MNQPLVPEMKSNDEIDLRELLRKIKSLFSRTFSLIVYIVRLILRRWVYFVICCALGAALTYAYHSTQRPYYAYSMTALLSEVRNDLVQDQIENLVLMVHDNNHKELAKQLGISEEAASSIKSIDFRNLDQGIIAEDSVLTGSPFELNVLLYNNQIQDSIEHGIVNYLEYNPYLAKQMRVKKEHLETIVAKLKEDIKHIDSQKVAAVNLRGPANGFVYGEPLDPSTLYKQSIEMMERQTQLEATLKRLQYIDVIVSFAPRIHRTGPMLKHYLLVGVALTFILSLAYALYSDRKRNLLV